MKKRVPLRLITILNPNGCLKLCDSDLPESQKRDVASANVKRIEEAEKVGAEPVKRGEVIDNGVQPFEADRNKTVSASKIADIVVKGGYYGTYVFVQKGEAKVRKLELRPGVPNRMDGLLSPIKLAIVIKAMRENVEFVKIVGLWVNPSETGEHANLVVRGIQDEKGERRKAFDLPIIEDNGVFYAEVPED